MQKTYFKETWNVLVAKYCGDHTITENLFNELMAAYNGTGRHYHNLSHIDHLLRLCSEYHNQLRQADLVKFAAWYHDIVYEPGRSDNESRSAVIALERLKLLGLDTDKAGIVRVFILATKDHNIPAITDRSDLEFFLDFDLSILAADQAVYKAYARHVREEYKLYPDQVYNSGRASFLNSTLQKPFIFYTEAFRAFEGKARENIKWELQKLASL